LETIQKPHSKSEKIVKKRSRVSDEFSYRVMESIFLQLSRVPTKEMTVKSKADFTVLNL